MYIILIAQFQLQDSKAEAVVSTIMELEKLYSDRITALEKALVQKDAMVGDLEEQNKNMMSQLNLNRCVVNRIEQQFKSGQSLMHASVFKLTIMCVPADNRTFSVYAYVNWTTNLQ